MTVFVLWEDKAISPIASFGPHMFLVACVASRLRMARYRLMRSEAIDGKPCERGEERDVERVRQPEHVGDQAVVALEIHLDQGRHRRLEPALRDAIAWFRAHDML